MKHCYECGTLLTEKQCQGEGYVPYCPHCQAFRFPIFNTAISTVVLSPRQDKVLLIQQYGRQDYILVAGYVMQGESAEQTLLREVKEETNLDVMQYRYMSSEYFQKSNTLVCNFVSVVNSEDLSCTNHEIDAATWFTFDEALAAIKKDSLAQKFLIRALAVLR